MDLAAPNVGELQIPDQAAAEQQMLVPNESNAPHGVKSVQVVDRDRA